MEFGMLGSQNSIILYVSVNTDRTGPFLYFKSIYFLISIFSNFLIWVYIWVCSFERRPRLETESAIGRWRHRGLWRPIEGV